MGAAGFRLPNGRTAAYEWGSGALSLASSLRLGAGTETRMLAALAEARAWWSTPAEFARYVAVLHESVHCLQDLTTGVGLWDFALWNAREGAVLVELRNASWGTPFGTPLPAAEVSAYHGWLDDGFVPQSAKARARRKLYLQQRISAETVVGALRDPDVFAIDRLLEAEAVVQVTLGLFRLRKTPAEREVMMDQLALWSAPDMAELYQGVYHDVIDLAARWWDADGRVADRKTVQVALWLTCFLIDLSLAHPSMEYLDANGLNPPDYDPGLKFILLVSALARLTTEQHNACLQSLLVRRDVAEAERILLEACTLPYPASARIYEDWAKRLEGSRGVSEDRRVELRLLAVRRRLAYPAGFLFKSMTSFFEHDLPLILVHDEGFRLTSLNPLYTVERARFELPEDIVREQSLKRLCHAMVDGAPFVCTHAEFGMCHASMRICREGMSRAEEFPARPGCAMRNWLEGSHFGIFGPVRQSRSL